MAALPCDCVCHYFVDSVRPNPALNADAHRRAFSPPAVAG